MTYNVFGGTLNHTLLCGPIPTTDHNTKCTGKNSNHNEVTCLTIYLSIRPCPTDYVIVTVSSCDLSTSTVHW